MASGEVVVVVIAGEGVGREHRLAPGQRLSLGRAEEAGCQLRDPDASRRHAVLACTPQGVVQLLDLGGRNGTFVGGRRLPANQPQVLTLPATVRIGSHELSVLPRGAEPAQAVPTLAEQYEVISELGSGGAGTVHEARHRASGRVVAIKGLHQRVEGEDAARQRFLLEAGVRVQHPNVVQILDVVVESGHTYIVMEFLEQGSVEQALAKGPLPVETCLWIGTHAALGLGALHDAGIIHRDVKPANILVTADRVAKIADFGIAKHIGTVEHLTATGQGMGTLAYVSPEQASDAKRIGPPADVYSLGATLYHMLAGRPVFLTSSMEVLVEVLEVDPSPLQDLRPDCPPLLAELIHDMLAKAPDDRPPDMGSMVTLLRQLDPGTSA